MVKLFYIIWQLPQTILGIILLLILHPEMKKVVKNHRIYYSNKINYSITLGEIIIIPMKYYSSFDITSSEELQLGHYYQSLCFGWWYLIIITIPFLIYSWFNKNSNNEEFYTEKWADELMWSKYKNNQYQNSKYQRYCEVFNDTLKLAFVLHGLFIFTVFLLI